MYPKHIWDPENILDRFAGMQKASWGPETMATDTAPRGYGTLPAAGSQVIHS